MYSIRQGLFETNSSSSHMLCISNNPSAMKIPAQIKVSDLKKTGWVQEGTNETLDKLRCLYFLAEQEAAEDRFIQWLHNSFGIEIIYDDWEDEDVAERIFGYSTELLGKWLFTENSEYHSDMHYKTREELEQQGWEVLVFHE